MSSSPPGPARLFFHPTSSASMRVTLYLRCRGIGAAQVRLVSTGFETDHRGIPVYTLPENEPETRDLGTRDLTALNPEGRVPILLLPDGRSMTQSGPIIELIEALYGGPGPSLLPSDPLLQAEVRRIAWIVAADVQPYQNIPFIIQAIGEWGMVRANPVEHPLRLHFIRREFGALEAIVARTAGRFAVGDAISYADCFLVPQIRNALLAGIDLAEEFPALSRVWQAMLDEPPVRQVLDEAGGVVQPLAFDDAAFRVYAAGAPDDTNG